VVRHYHWAARKNDNDDARSDDNHRLSDYRSVNGLMVPWKIVTTDEVGLPKVTSLTSVETDTPAIAEHLRMPLSSAHDYSLTGTETSVPIELIDDQIFVDVMINGKGPFHFLWSAPQFTRTHK
jgi:hypothetical protein